MPLSIEPVRVDAVIVPAEPLFSAVIEASQAVSRRYKNANIIDAQRWPPHVSLHIGTVPPDRLETLCDAFDELDTDLTPVIVPERLTRRSRGYISLKVTITDELRALHEQVLECFAKARAGFEEPIPGWASDSDRDRTWYRRYGNTYIFDRFDAHLSVAKVSRENHDAAHEVASAALGTTAAGKASVFELRDIGPHNERWDLIYASDT
jgi:hypothetical protein